MQTSLPGQVSVGCAPRTRIYDCLTRRASCCDVTISPLDSLRNYVLLHPAPNLRQPILTHPEVRSALREAIEHVRARACPSRSTRGYCCRIIYMRSGRCRKATLRTVNAEALSNRIPSAAVSICWSAARHAAHRESIGGRLIFGKGASGSIKYAMTATSNVVSTTSITIRSNIGW